MVDVASTTATVPLCMRSVFAVPASFKVAVVGQHAVGADNLHVGDARPAQEGHRGLCARGPAPTPKTFEYLLKVRLTRALAQSESPNPGRMKRKYIGSKNIALPLHGERCRGRGVALFWVTIYLTNRSHGGSLLATFRPPSTT